MAGEMMDSCLLQPVIGVTRANQVLVYAFSHPWRWILVKANRLTLKELCLVTSDGLLQDFLDLVIGSCSVKRWSIKGLAVMKAEMSSRHFGRQQGD
jgi:hypothetical protein